MQKQRFNLLVTCPKGQESAACSKVWFLLGEIGDKDSKVDYSGVRGVVIAQTTLDPHEVIKKLRELLRSRPEEFMYTKRYIPIDVVVPTKLEELEKVGAELEPRIAPEEKFRITVEKRYSDIGTMDVINAVAKHINRKVDLKNPDKIVLVEIIGGLTGVSVITPDEILSVDKERQKYK